MKLKYLLGVFSIVALFVIGYYFSNSVTQANTYNDRLPVFVHEDSEQIIHKLVRKKEGIYYFGFPTCPWCVELLPVFNEVLSEHKKTAFVVNVRDKNYTNRQNGVLEKFYKQYTGEDGLSVPFVVAIDKNANVKVHVGTVDDHDASKKRLTSVRKEELINVLSDLIR